MDEEGEKRDAQGYGVSRRSVSARLGVCNSLSAFVDRQKQRPIDRDVDIGEGGWFARRDSEEEEEEGRKRAITEPGKSGARSKHRVG